jgi:dolichol-phosphate mannosyltransferase
VSKEIVSHAYDLSIVIPCLNEAKNLEELLPLIRDFISDLVDYEIIVVDGGSQDNTMQVAERLGAIAIRQQGKGYGNALKTGFASARGEYVLTMDGDLSHHPSLIPNMIRRRQEADVLIASRFIRQGYSRAPFSRHLMSMILNKTFQIAVSMPFEDVSSGFRIYRKCALDSIQIEMENYNVLQEILVKIYVQGYQIKEIPFHYKPRHKGRSKAKVFKYGFEYFRYLPTAWRLRNNSDSADYDELAFHSRHPLQKYWQRQRYEIIVDAVGNDKKILDIGSGSSMIMEALPHSFSLDIMSNRLRYKNHDTKRHSVQGTIFSLPFDDGEFDCVIFSQVIEHLPKDDVILDECVRVIRQGGKLIFGTPDYGGWQWPMFEWLYSIVNPIGYVDEHITHFTLESCIEELERRGLTIQYYKYILKAELIIVATV